MKTPEQLRPLLDQFQQTSDIDLVVVGGQAINLWAMRYFQPVPAWEQWLPFASEDIDLLGDRLDAVALHQLLGGELYLARDFDPSPNSGVILVRLGQDQIRVDVLANLYGINEVDAQASSLKLESEELPLHSLRASVL